MENVFQSTLEMFKKFKPTPLVKMQKLSREGMEVFAKLEFFNPFSRSIKDRTIFNMFTKAKERGDLDAAKKLVEGTSGNAGLSLAALSSIMGVKFKAYIPRTTPETTEILLRVFGTEIVRLESETLDPHAIAFVKGEAEKTRGVNLNQFENNDNFDAHYRYTAPEIDRQLESIGKKPEVIIAGCGTSGHIAGLTTYFKKKYNGIRVVGVVPSKGEKIPGIKGLETEPKWFYKVKIDDVIEVTQREAIRSAIEIARAEGILIGLSSGAVVNAFHKVAGSHGEGTYVLIFPDDGFKYITAFKKYFEEMNLQ